MYKCQTCLFFIWHEYTFLIFWVESLTRLLTMERLTDTISSICFILKDAARQRSVISARSAGENPGAEGHALFSLPASLSVWLLWGCLGEQQPKGKCGGRRTKGNFKKSSKGRSLAYLRKHSPMPEPHWVHVQCRRCLPIHCGPGVRLCYSLKLNPEIMLLTLFSHSLCVPNSSADL